MKRAKLVRDSITTLAVQMLPSDANPMGSVHGGSVLKLVDTAAAVAAMRHARCTLVTASIDRMDFYHPVYVGNLLILKSSVNYTGRTSLEAGVRIEAEDLRTGKITHTGSSYVTYVALNEKGKPMPVPQVIPETAEEKRRWREGKERREQRLKLQAGQGRDKNRRQE
jgi:uncharacterized protein (TIGR00369 family)